MRGGLFELSISIAGAVFIVILSMACLYLFYFPNTSIPDFKTLCYEKCDSLDKVIMETWKNKCVCCNVDVSITLPDNKSFWRSEYYDCETFYLEKAENER